MLETFNVIVYVSFDISSLVGNICSFKITLYPF